EDEKAALGDDLKELFAELKAFGFTPKALRESFRRVRNINDADQQEHDAIVDLYVASLTGAGRARTREIIEEFGAAPAADPPAHDLETGEITEQPETAHPIQERPSTNDEASPEAGPQAEASLAGTGT